MRPPFRSPLAAAARPARSPAAAPAAGLDLAQDPAPTARSVGLLLEGLEPTDTIRVDGRAVPTPANRFLPLERGRYARVEVSRSGLSLGVGAELKAAPPRAVPLDTMTVLNGVAVSLVGWARLELIGFDPRTRFFVDTLPVETKADPSTGIFTLRIRLTGGPMALGALGPEGSVREGTVAPRPGDLLDVLFTDLSAAPRTPWYLQAGVPTLRPVVTPPTATPSPTAAAPQATPAATALQATPAPTQPPAPTGLAPTRAPSSIQSAPAAPSRGRAVGSLLLGSAAALAIGAVAVMSLRGAGSRRANPGSPWKPVRVWSTEEPDGTLLWRYSLRSRGGGVLIEGHYAGLGRSPSDRNLRDLVEHSIRQAGVPEAFLGDHLVLTIERPAPRSRRLH